MDPTSELAVRIAAAASLFALLAGWELRAPRRPLVAGRRPRWPGNIGILLVDALAVRLLVPTAAVGTAVLAAERGWGLFNAWALSPWIAGVFGFLLLDLVIYGQHVALHKVPVLWRLHRMHHADVDIDVTTGLRFHPIEIVLSMALKMAVVIVLGIPALAVLAFEVVLNATSMFNHANVALPRRLEPVMRWLVVTPQMHEVHHSVSRIETDSNFGFNLPWWDRLFRTYRARRAAGQQGAIGLPNFRGAEERRLGRLLTQPFRDDATGADQPPSAAESMRV